LGTTSLTQKQLSSNINLAADKILQTDILKLSLLGKQIQQHSKAMLLYLQNTLNIAEERILSLSEKRQEELRYSQPSQLIK